MSGLSFVTYHMFIDWSKRRESYLTEKRGYSCYIAGRVLRPTVPHRGYTLRDEREDSWSDPDILEVPLKDGVPQPDQVDHRSLDVSSDGGHLYQIGTWEDRQRALRMMAIGLVDDLKEGVRSVGEDPVTKYPLLINKRDGVGSRLTNFLTEYTRLNVPIPLEGFVPRADGGIPFCPMLFRLCPWCGRTHMVVFREIRRSWQSANAATHMGKCEFASESIPLRLGRVKPKTATESEAPATLAVSAIQTAETAPASSFERALAASTK